jgi:hypothetical protein
MDAPVWSNDLLYLKEMILTSVVTAAIIYGCFYLSRRADRRRTDRVAHGLPATKSPTASARPTKKS